MLGLYMKVAIVYDVFIKFGGVDRVLLAFLDIFPMADMCLPLFLEKNRELLTIKLKME